MGGVPGTCKDQPLPFPTEGGEARAHKQINGVRIDVNGKGK